MPFRIKILVSHNTDKYYNYSIPDFLALILLLLLASLYNDKNKHTIVAPF